MGQLKGEQYIRIIALMLLPVCMSCNNHEEPYDGTKQVRIDYVFEPFITEMDSSSIISLPIGVITKGIIINSTKELVRQVPSEVLDSDSIYENIDFSEKSMLSLTFRLFYMPDKLEYRRIYKEEDGTLTVNQLFYVSSELQPKGYFIMSNVIMDKVDSTNIYLTQSIQFAH